MADYAVDRSKAATLTANVQDVVTINRDAEGVLVLKRTDAGELWVKVDSDAAVAVGDDNSFCLPAGIGERLIPSHKSGNTTVKLIADSAIAYWVGIVG